MASHVVGIMGLKGSGKDTFASRLIEHHGFTRLAFADALKALALDIDPIVDASNYSAMRLSELVNGVGWDRAKQTPEVRRLLQDLGVSVRARVDEEVWVNILARAAGWIPGPVVVTDVRFRNEVTWVSAQRGALVRVIRNDQVNNDLHISETDLLNRRANFIVRADKGDVEKLYSEADFLAGSMGLARDRARI